MSALLLLLSLAHAAPADPVDEDDADVVASLTFQASPERVFEHLADLRNVVAASPERCMRKWELGDDPEGKGATFRVVYLMEAFRRRLDGTVSVAEEPRRIEWDHEGNRGFLTRFSLTGNDSGGTEVEVHTFLLPPPWPFKRYYRNTVRPRWEQCYLALLGQMNATLGPDPVLVVDPADLGPVRPAPVDMPVQPAPELDPGAVDGKGEPAH